MGGETACLLATGTSTSDIDLPQLREQTEADLTSPSATDIRNLSSVDTPTVKMLKLVCF